MPDTASPFIDIARQALAAYGLPDARLAFIRHSDTATYRGYLPGGCAGCGGGIFGCRRISGYSFSSN